MKTRTLKVCKHFDLKAVDKYCKVDESSPLATRCIRGDGEPDDCEKYEPLVVEDDTEEMMERVKKMVNGGPSICCNAPVNNSQVITSGRFKNHGPRFCSLCGEMVYQV